MNVCFPFMYKAILPLDFYLFLFFSLSVQYKQITHTLRHPATAFLFESSAAVDQLFPVSSHAGGCCTSPQCHLATSLESLSSQKKAASPPSCCYAKLTKAAEQNKDAIKSALDEITVYHQQLKSKRCEVRVLWQIWEVLMRQLNILIFFLSFFVRRHMENDRQLINVIIQYFKSRWDFFHSHVHLPSPTADTASSTA